ncbi:MAG: hypothetical protein AB7N65_31510 [Vicinamibacterales bacterium]
MRLRTLLVPLLLLSIACGAGPGDLFKQYEYEEETYLSLDGSATVYVNSSVPALNQLRGAAFDPAEDAVLDKAAVADFFSGPGVTVRRVTFSRRNGRNYLHVRMDVDDVRRLGSSRPFGWSSYAFARDRDLMVYRQRVGAAVQASNDPPHPPSWTGDEIVGFRIHIPSKVPYHNAGADNLKRGNILVWEQALSDRLAGRELDMEVRMETQSILYRTLALFGITIVLVGILFAILLWWIVRVKGREQLQRAGVARHRS